VRVRVIAVGGRMPRWVDEVFGDYTRRLRGGLGMTLTEIPLGSRSRGAASERATDLEARRLLGALRDEEYVVVLDERGRELRSRELAQWLQQRMHAGRDLAFVIGGPDGISAAVAARADFTWSLSQLTLPHALVRVLVAEQLYRAHSLLAAHPYHRE
jgi:23S rRNA (pseudouridine1915-N3)-methyltransferase